MEKLNYTFLLKKFKEKLSKISKKEKEDWLEFDNLRLNKIETEEDYTKALKIIDSLIDCDDDSEDFKKLEHLSILVDKYENKHYKI